VNFKNGRKFEITHGKEDAAHLPDKDPKNLRTLALSAASRQPMPPDSKKTR
jgi:hypothetical protein